jgi:hypothetical protein
VDTSLYSVNTGLKIEASINVANISGVGAACFPRLYFQVKLRINEEASEHLQKKVQAWSFGTLVGELIIGTEKVADIKTYSMNQRRLGNQKYPVEEYHVNVEIPLDARRIEWLEQQRAGKSFSAILRINLEVQLFGNNPHTPDFPCGLIDVSCIYGDIPFTVPDTHWREKVLPGLGYGNVMVVELPAVSLVSCKELDHSYKALEKAQKQFSLGLYDETAGSCRIAIEQFFETLEDASGKKVPRLKKSWESRLGAATHQWLDSSLGAIKDATNKPHHSAHNHFNRLGAQMLLMVTTALVSYAAQHFSTESE